MKIYQSTGRKRMGHYGFAPIVAAALPLVAGLFQQGSAPDATPPPTSTNPLVYAALAIGGAALLGGTAYLVLKK